MIKLHGLDVSGNTYKAKLLMSLMNIEYEFLAINVANGQHKSDDFLQLNPRGEFPVLEVDSMVIWDSQAILVYLARQYETQSNNPWYPNTATDMALVTQWLCVANDDIFNSLGKARSMLKFDTEGDLDLFQQKGRAMLKWIERHLSQRNWLATNHPSIADIACYPYVALCEEGNISLQGYPAIHRWFKRIQSLDGYISMPGITSPGITSPE